MSISRRGLLGLGACFGLGLAAGARLGLPHALGPGRPRAVTGRALALVEEAFAGIDRSKMWDVHVHVTGIGTGGSGCWVNPRMRSLWHPYAHFKFDVYRAAAGVTEMARADQQYVERLLALHRLANPAGKLVVMAFDMVVGEDGRELPEASEMFVPNGYVLELARTQPEIVACASVHPYRADAVERLDRAVEGGARAVKWLPNAMRMDPAARRCDPFYARLATLGIPLICHGGKELAVDSPEHQELGNPLRLERALAAGVRVVVAHAASLGTVDDLGVPERARITAFDAFMRLFSQSQYQKTLFADISALTQTHRADPALREILISKDLHPRLVNGSDYPLPCIDPLFSTRLLAKHGWLAPEDRPALGVLFDANPLLFDFVLKRRVSAEYKQASYAFPPSVFETAWLFESAKAS